MLLHSRADARTHLDLCVVCVLKVDGHEQHLQQRHWLVGGAAGLVTESGREQVAAVLKCACTHLVFARQRAHDLFGPCKHKTHAKSENLEGCSIVDG